MTCVCICLLMWIYLTSPSARAWNCIHYYAILSDVRLHTVGKQTFSKHRGFFVRNKNFTRADPLAKIVPAISHVHSLAEIVPKLQFHKCAPIGQICSRTSISHCNRHFWWINFLLRLKWSEGPKCLTSEHIWKIVNSSSPYEIQVCQKWIA